MRTDGSFLSPGKKMAKSKSVTKVFEFEKDIRRAVYNLYDAEEFCTAQQILNSLKKKINFFWLIKICI
jgi:hypothetical protein